LNRRLKFSTAVVPLLLFVTGVAWWLSRTQPISTAPTIDSTPNEASEPSDAGSIDVPLPPDSPTPVPDAKAMAQPSGPTTTIAQYKLPATPAVREYAIETHVVDSANRTMDPLRLSVIVEDENRTSSPLDAYPPSYMAMHLHKGRFTVSVRSDGYESQTANVELTSKNPVHSLNLVMRSATTLKIKMLTEDGHDLAEQVSAEKRTWPNSMAGSRIIDGFPPFDSAAVIPVATREKPGDRLPETRLRNHSRFGAGIYCGWGSSYTNVHRRSSERLTDNGIPPGFTGVLELFEPLPLYVSATVRNVVIESKLIPEGATEVTFNISLDQVKACFGEARLRVVDALSDLPLNDCVVELGQLAAPRAGSPGDKESEIVFQHVQRGPVALRIIARDHETIQEEVRIEPGKLNDLGTYRLQPAISIQGVVLDPSGKPARLSSMSLIPLDGFDPGRQRGVFVGGGYIVNGVPWSSFETDEFGGFRAMNVRRGKYLLRLVGLNSPPCLLVVDTTGGSVDGLRLQAAQGPKVTFHFDRDADEDDWIRVFDADDLPVREVDATSPGGWLDGRRPVYLSSGAYKCAVFSHGARSTTFNVEVGSAPMTVEVPR
jgi:hypothetical protein